MFGRIRLGCKLYTRQQGPHGNKHRELRYTEGKGISKQARQTTTDDDAVERLKARCTGESDRRDKDEEQPLLTGTFELRTG